MSKKNNVNPNHYKTRGREKPGQEIVHEIHKQKLTQTADDAEEQAKIIGGQSPSEKTSLTSETDNDTGQIIESANSSSNT